MFGTPPIKPLPAAYADYPGFNPLTAPNGGRGFSKQLGGNELPNAPHFTATITGNYTVPLANDWLMTLHSDVHWQSQSWWRVFNDNIYDKLHPYFTMNLAAIFTNEDAGWNIMTYIKNVTDETAITGAFLNSDDSGLTTNVFLTEPRLYGLRVTKDFSGSVLGWVGDASSHNPDTPYPFEVQIGGGMSRFDKGAERYVADWMTPALAPSLAAQDHDLDWGDIRSIKLAYRPTDGWNVSATYMYGKTNGQSRQGAYENVPGIDLSTPDIPKYLDQPDNNSVTAVHDAEEFSVADFKVGRDVGMGAFGAGGTSMLAVGLRYASLQSNSSIGTAGIEGSYMAPDVTFTTGVRRHNAYETSLDSRREFDGAGPTVSWDASIRLLGDDQGGHADLDWSIGGGVLFGKQSMDSTERGLGTNYSSNRGSLANAVTLQKYDVTPLYNHFVPRHRSDDATVPNLSLALGLSYEVDRIKVSTGYSYDRFFDAIDGGIDTAKQYDRTIDGPYFKIAVGFGG